MFGQVYGIDSLEFAQVWRTQVGNTGICSSEPEFPSVCACVDVCECISACGQSSKV